MTTPIPVSLAGDSTWGICLHKLDVPPWDVVESPAPMDWPPGGPTNAHRLASAVFHKGQRVVQEKHDLGPLLPHLPGASPDSRTEHLKSSRRSVFSCRSVKLHGLPAATIRPARGALLHLCGSPMSGTLGTNSTNSMHSVFVGMTFADYFIGAGRTMGILYADAGAAALGIAVELFGLEDLFNALDYVGLNPVKILLSAPASFIESVAASIATNGEEPITYSLTAGPYGTNATAGLSYQPSTGEISFKIGYSHAGGSGEVGLTKDRMTIQDREGHDGPLESKDYKWDPAWVL